MEDREKIIKTVKDLVDKGDLSRATFELKRYMSLNRTDLAVKSKLADIYLKSGEKMQAKVLYSEIASEYANKGFLIQAIAANKRILEIDPGHKETQKSLAHFYAQKAKKTLEVEVPDEKAEISTAEIKEDVEDIEIGSADEPAVAPLPKFPLFSDLAEDEFIAIVNEMKSRVFYAQSIIFKEGDSGDSIYLIGSGKVNIYKRDSAGKQVLLRVINTGDFFGEFGYFANSVRNFSAIASEEAHLLELTRDDIELLIGKFPGVSNALVEFYKKRVLDTILGVTPVFRDLPYIEREKFLPKFQLKIGKAGNHIIKEGDPGGSMFVIVSGKVEVWTYKGGKKIVLATLKEGDVFGEISVVTGEVRTATVTAVKECRLMQLNKGDFDEIAGLYPNVLRVTKNILEQRLSDTLAQVVTSEKKELI
ncbi:MAG TPA: cyclic nucleotide-binding domain-containing protein [bacterium]